MQVKASIISSKPKAASTDLALAAFVLVGPGLEMLHMNEDVSVSGPARF